MVKSNSAGGPVVQLEFFSRSDQSCRFGLPWKVEQSYTSNQCYGLRKAVELLGRTRRIIDLGLEDLSPEESEQNGIDTLPSISDPFTRSE